MDNATRYFIRNIKIVCFLLFATQNIFAQVETSKFIKSISRNEDASYFHRSENNIISYAADDIINSFSPSSFLFEYSIQVGAFAKKSNALKLKSKLSNDGYHVDVYENYLHGKPLLYLVWVGTFNSVDDALTGCGKIWSNYKISGVLRMRTATLYNTMKTISFSQNNE